MISFFGSCKKTFPGYIIRAAHSGKRRLAFFITGYSLFYIHTDRVFLFEILELERGETLQWIPLC